MYKGTVKKISARDCGAYADGLHNDTKALQYLIDRCSREKCTAVLDRGVFLCTTLYLKNDVTLEICPEAVLKAASGISS
ncbi:MAG TPA: hypothetical protein PLT66_03645 [Bacillota bacterium]|nr:hypothetical protein [Bacillota bacterium]